MNSDNIKTKSLSIASRAAFADDNIVKCCQISSWAGSGQKTLVHQSFKSYKTELYQPKYFHIFSTQWVNGFQIIPLKTFVPFSDVKSGFRGKVFLLHRLENWLTQIHDNLILGYKAYLLLQL